MTADLIISVSEFKARSLKLVDDLAQGRLGKITVTKRGKPVAVVSSIVDRPLTFSDVHGSMRDTITITAGVDLTEPLVDPDWEEEMLRDWDAQTR